MSLKTLAHVVSNFLGTLIYNFLHNVSFQTVFILLAVNNLIDFPMHRQDSRGGLEDLQPQERRHPEQGGAGSQEVLRPSQEKVSERVRRRISDTIVFHKSSAENPLLCYSLL